ncbi:LOW QUALITY PROTEIN: protein BTG4-like [Macrobrachium nipponense]|uniref:LOW QUALITY PROTEIN: protein BTG4-like n=1 Tax=Macrobrachium nipponense TaxID=159736 RepID=UPI0030C86503
MKEEISAAVCFISKLIRRNSNEDEEKIEKFEQCLEELLRDRFSTHWHPSQPWRGQGYRCLRLNENTRREPMIERAAKECGLNYDRLNLPVELTIWVDPEEVCCRFGEHKGSCCTIASFKDGNKENNIDKFDFSEIERPSSTPSGMVKSAGVLRERTFNNCNNSSPPSSTQSTPTKRKSFSPTHSVYNYKNQNSGRGGTGSPGRGNGGLREKRHFDNNFHFNGNPHHLPQPPHHSSHANGSYSPPFYKTQSWLNLSQTPPPPPPTAHLPMFSSAGFIYPPTPAPHYTHSPSHYNRSPPHMGSAQKFKWNSGSYLRNDRHQWYGQRVLARV